MLVLSPEHMTKLIRDSVRGSRARLDMLSSHHRVERCLDIAL
jgi:hypothetical protein